MNAKTPRTPREKPRNAQNQPFVIPSERSDEGSPVPPVELITVIPGRRTLPHDHVQFVPSRVDGLPDVTSITVFADRIELASASGVLTHRFVDIARWPVPAFLWKLLYRLGVKPRWLPVANRDWFHEPADMFFAFYTTPPLKICMPRDESKEDFGSSYFVRIQTLLREGGFHTFDLG